MTDMRCETVRERIPDLVGGRLGAAEASRIDAHLEGCVGCRAEAELVRSLFVGRARAPAALAERIRAAMSEQRRHGGRRPWWGLAAAAVAALALGIGAASRSAPDTGASVPGFVAEGTGGTGAWVSDNGMIAGAPAFDGLSDDALRTLLDEMDGGGTGGSA